MEKTKRVSKSTLAIVILAILLTLSIVVGISGAWFTATGESGQKSETLNFGKVDISATSSLGSPTWTAKGLSNSVAANVMPGSTFSGTITVSNAAAASRGIDIWCGIKSVTATLRSGSVSGSTFTCDKITVNGGSSGEGSVVAIDAGANHVFNVAITVDESLTNEYNDVTYNNTTYYATFEIVFGAVQKQGIANAATAWTQINSAVAFN